MLLFLRREIYFLSLFFFITSLSYSSFSENLVLDNSYGTIGIIDMPIAGSFDDGELGFSTSNFGAEVRNTLSFQALPRLSGSFRYSGVGDKKTGFFEKSGHTTWDRSFDLKIDIIKEKRSLPAVSVGLLDFIGTGLSSSEYLVASKNIGNSVRSTLGLGWGRLATANKISNNGIRNKPNPGGKPGLGGTINADKFFKGDIGLFGGLEIFPYGNNLKLNLEISSDSYNTSYYENKSKSKINYGASYKINNNLSLGSYFVRGREIGFQLNLKANPEKTKSINLFQVDTQPFYSDPIKFKKGDDSYIHEIKKDMLEQKLSVLAVKENDDEFIIFIENYHFSSNVKSMGRTLRSLSKFVPIDITDFTVVLTELGLPISKLTVDRNELASIIDAPNAELLSSKIIKLTDAKSVFSNTKKFKNENIFNISVTPYYRLHLFDPDKPFYYDFGPDLNLKINPKTGLYFSGKLEYSLISNFNEIWRGPKGNLTHVRSDLRNYLVEKGPRITDLKGESFFKMSDKYYGRISVGYFEPMYGGISTEILRSSINSNLSFGAELNYVKARDYDQKLGFRKLQGLSNLNGHLSANWDTNYYNYISKIDIGKYLAGDKGGTFTLMRKWPNGWNIGAFFTLTDASFEKFGEGSFDKGFFVRIPFHTIAPYDTRYGLTELVRPIQGDGGARLHVDNRLFDVVFDKSNSSYKKSWATLWR